MSPLPRRRRLRKNVACKAAVDSRRGKLTARRCAACRRLRQLGSERAAQHSFGSTGASPNRGEAWRPEFRVSGRAGLDRSLAPPTKSHGDAEALRLFNLELRKTGMRRLRSSASGLSAFQIPPPRLRASVALLAPHASCPALQLNYIAQRN